MSRKTWLSFSGGLMKEVEGKWTADPRPGRFAVEQRGKILCWTWCEHDNDHAELELRLHPKTMQFVPKSEKSRNRVFILRDVSVSPPSQRRFYTLDPEMMGKRLIEQLNTSLRKGQESASVPTVHPTTAAAAAVNWKAVLEDRTVHLSCAVCRKPHPKDKDSPSILQPCPACRIVHYCCNEHRSQHMREHATQCQQVATTRAMLGQQRTPQYQQQAVVTLLKLLNKIAEDSQQLRQWSEALCALGEVSALFSLSGDWRNLGVCMNRFGVVYEKMKDWPRALDAHTKGLEMAQALQLLPLQAASHVSIGAIYQSQGKIEQAIASFEQDLRLCLRLNDQSREAQAYGRLGNLHRLRHAHREALNYWELDRALSESMGDRGRVGMTCGNLGVAYERAGDYQRSLECNEMALAIAKESGDKDEESRHYGNIGLTHMSMGNYETALDCHQQHLALAKQLGDRDGEAQSYSGIGLAHQYLHHYQESFDAHQKHLKLALELGDRKSEGGLGVSAIFVPSSHEIHTPGGAYLNLGQAHNGLCQYQEALNFFEKGLKIHIESKDQYAEGKSYGGLGLVYDAIGDSRRAVAFHEKHLEICLALGDKGGEGTAYQHLMNAHNSIGNFRQALELGKKRLQLALEMQDIVGERTAYSGLGSTYKSLGDYAQSITYHQKDLDISIAHDDQPGIGATFGNLGNVYSHLGNFEKAIACHKKCLKIATDLNSTHRVISTNLNMASVYTEMRRFDKAIELYKEAIKMAKKQGNQSSLLHAYNDIGLMLFHNGQAENALEYHTRCLEMSNALNLDKDACNAHVNLGLDHLNLGHFALAVSHNEQAIAITQRLETKDEEAIALTNLGRAAQLQGLYSEAHALQQQAVAILDSVRSLLGHDDASDARKVSLFEQRLDIHTQLVEMCLWNGLTGDALIAAERGRARAFVDALAPVQHGYDGASDDAVTMEALQHVAHTCNTTTVLYAIVHVAKWDSQNEKLARTETLCMWAIPPDYNKPIAFHALETKRILGVELTPFINAMREHARLDDHDLMGRGTLRPVAPLNTSDGAVPAIDIHMQQQFKPHVTDLCLLSRLLLAPIAQYLPKPDSKQASSDLHTASANVTFVPQQALFLVPFSALPQPGTGGVLDMGDGASWPDDWVSGYHPLMETCAVSVIPSVEALGRIAQRQPAAATHPALVVGRLAYDPSLNVSPLAGRVGLLKRMLEGTGKGAGSTSSSGSAPSAPAPGQGGPLHPKGATLLTGVKATLPRVVSELRAGVPLFHIDTHGEYVEKRPDQSCVLLSGTDRLTAQDVRGLDLSAVRLVVLSACDSGRGKITGDGVIGLVRAFLAAGVPAVVASLWPTHSEPTKELMQHFYSAWLKEEDNQTGGVAEAVRIAMRRVRAMPAYVNPSYWAPFVVFGHSMSGRGHASG